MQRDLQDAEGRSVPDDAVAGHGDDRSVVGAARSHRDLRDSVYRIGHPGRGLRSEPLVDVVVAVEHEVCVGAGRVEHLPELLAVGIGPPAGAEQRDVPVGEDALVAVGRQIRSEPFALGRSGTATAGAAAVAVQGD